ncbi:MAG: hypothetical protein B9S36_03755 [Verrucomicrobiia bacterium Tous-C2TDCM]|nr:MAG: hypothetical protein B9S36_03755 [Verrucomicrobiae bacterium Tous-C2TDCM]
MPNRKNPEPNKRHPIFPAKRPNQSIPETMSQPQTFETVLATLRSESSFHEHLSRHREGDVNDLIESTDFEDFVQNRSDLEEIIEASGGEGYDFEIEVLSFGPIFWVRAPEFDDIGYFTSLEDALWHAREFYEPYIETLAALRESEEEE